MKSRQELMAEIEFESRIRRKRTLKDITLTVNAKGKVALYFRNGAHEKFKDGFVFGIYKNRIVFDRDNGYGYFPKVNDGRRWGAQAQVTSITVSDTEKYKDWIGDYKLQWDEFYEFWYIEREEG